MPSIMELVIFCPTKLDICKPHLLKSLIKMFNIKALFDIDPLCDVEVCKPNCVIYNIILVQRLTLSISDYKRIELLSNILQNILKWYVPSVNPDILY